MTEGPYPRTWLMLGPKDGDNAQILGLAEALGWPFEIKTIAWRPTELLTNLTLGPNLFGIVRRDSSPLAPPWPELIVSAGRRNEPVCRWVQREAAKDGHAVKLVHVGRPWASHECFDLVVTTPQYRLPHKANILHNTTPLHRVTESKLRAAAAEWAPRFAHLPRPRIAVLLGGNAGPYTFDPEAGDQLGRAAAALARAEGGSVLVTSSRRTPADALAALEAALDVPRFVHAWRKGAADNPFFGLLALGDAFVVTSDSMSMLTEAASTERPVHIFDLDDNPRTSQRAPAVGGGPRTPWWWKRLRRFGFRPLVYRLGIRAGPKRLTRDVSLIHRDLVGSGRAVWLGQPWPDRRPPPLEDRERAVARVRALFPQLRDAPRPARDAA